MRGESHGGLLGEHIGRAPQRDDDEERHGTFHGSVRSLLADVFLLKDYPSPVAHPVPSDRRCEVRGMPAITRVEPGHPGGLTPPDRIPPRYVVALIRSSDRQAPRESECHIAGSRIPVGSSPQAASHGTDPRAKFEGVALLADGNERIVLPRLKPEYESRYVGETVDEDDSYETHETHDEGPTNVSTETNTVTIERDGPVLVSPCPARPRRRRGLRRWSASRTGAVRGATHPCRWPRRSVLQQGIGPSMSGSGHSRIVPPVCARPVREAKAAGMDQPGDCNGVPTAGEDQ
jgi:hypothetical protein